MSLEPSLVEAPTILDVIKLLEEALEVETRLAEVNRAVRRALFLRAYRLGYTLTEIGGAAGVSKTRVHQVVTRPDRLSGGESTPTG